MWEWNSRQWSYSGRWCFASSSEDTRSSSVPSACKFGRKSWQFCGPNPLLQRKDSFLWICLFPSFQNPCQIVLRPARNLEPSHVHSNVGEHLDRWSRMLKVHCRTELYQQWNLQIASQEWHLHHSQAASVSRISSSGMSSWAAKIS